MSDLGIEHTANSECINVISDKDILIYAANNSDATIDKNDTQTVHQDRKITVDGKHDETIKGDTTIKVTEGKLDHDVVAGSAKYHVKGEVTEIFENKQTTSVKNEIAITSETQHIYIHGCTSIQLHVGDSMIWMASDGNITIQGKHVQIIGSDKVEIHGGEVTSSADKSHEISGTSVKSAAKANNVVQGAMVMLNP